MPLSVEQLNKVKQLRTSMAYDALLGNYKAFRNAKKEYASLAIKDFHAVRQIKAPKVSVPLFSKQGLRLMFIAIREFFRIKTPEEKQLKKMGAEYKNQLETEKFIKNA